LALFVGACLANALASELRLPFERLYVRPIVLSFVGMSVTGVLMLRVLANDRDAN
jgi:hypothetical protein